MGYNYLDCWQINLQEGLGGGEVYTGFLTKALKQVGVRSHIFVSARARHWSRLLPDDTEVIPVDGIGDAVSRLPTQRNWVLSHGDVGPSVARSLAAKHLLTGIAHMPPQGRPRDRYLNYDLVFGVSAYVVDGLRLVGAPVWHQPLYAVADLGRDSCDAEICQTSCYDWDRRKGRDRVLGWFEPLTESMRKRPVFVRHPGLTLGIVSRLTPIKQFPQLFKIITPILAAQPDVNLEIFGAGGYASVRDLREALKPLGNRARFWGHQTNVKAVYGQLDALLSGLPEKEALGLNVIEAQASGVPVLAVDAPPFTETVADEITGWRYTDPRKDGGQDFLRVLSLLRGGLSSSIGDVDAHLARFSFSAFANVIQALVQEVNRVKAPVK